MTLSAESKRIVSLFELSNQDINSAVKEFIREMEEGLNRDGANLSQIPTYVTAVPNGSEKGVYLAVDLGGTNLRVCSVHLNGDTTFRLVYSKVTVPRELMTSKSSTPLFAFLATQVEDFLKKHNLSHPNKVFHLGFTFSFPVHQTGLAKGTLMRWTKGFDIPDAVGQDVCALFQAQLDKLNLPVKVAALVNDAVGTLMARSYTSHGQTRTLVGAIFGTGTNGAYVEKLANVKKQIPGDFDDSTGEMVINTEWGSFGNHLSVLPSTRWDQELDKSSVNPGIQMFEKRVSGMFLGEIVRLAILDLVNNSSVALFKSSNAMCDTTRANTNLCVESKMWQPWGVDTAIMSVAAADSTPELSILRLELENVLDINTPSLEDAQAFKTIAQAVGRRAARLSAVAIAAILLRSGQLSDPSIATIDIGVDGSLVEHYPFFCEMMCEALRAVEGIGSHGAAKVRIGIAKDGSGVGAALIALIADKAQKSLSGQDVEMKQNSGQWHQIAHSSFLVPKVSVTRFALAVGILGSVGLCALMWARRR